MYELIQHQKLDSAASSITFSNIPQTYTDLMLLISPVFSGQNYAYVSVNGTTTNYSFRNLLNELGSAATYTQTAYSINSFPVAPMWSQDSSIPTNSAVYFYNYTSNIAKHVSAEYFSEANSSTNIIGGILAGLWNSTAAISSLQVFVQPSNMAAGSSATLYGINRTSGIGRPKALGGSITYANGYWIHTFTSNGIFSAQQDLQAEYLVIAGGGGGAAERGGGGGAGGYRSSVAGEISGGGTATESAIALAANTSSLVIVGSGGAGSVLETVSGTNGSDSIFASIASRGGGGGGDGGTNGLSGGSGGGAGIGYTGIVFTGGSGTTNQGFAGGNSQPVSDNRGAGGGGGAGAAVSGSPNGGAGVASSITGTLTTRAGGGGAGDGTWDRSGWGPGTGAAGGGNGGGKTAGNVNGTSATTNTGSGGGGGGMVNGSTIGTGGNGGSGIVVVRYRA